MLTCKTLIAYGFDKRNPILSRIFNDLHSKNIIVKRHYYIERLRKRVYVYIINGMFNKFDYILN